MWKLLDKSYRFLFRHAIAIALVMLSAVILFTVLGPTHCNFGVERAKQSRMLSDMRTVKEGFHLAVNGNTTSVSLPLDVFAKPAQPISLLMTSGTLMLVSVGPDGLTRGDGIQYDATNGTTSYGDILSTVATGLMYDPGY